MWVVVAHNMLMTGPPGAGKTLIVRSMPGILPKLSIEEALDETSTNLVKAAMQQMHLSARAYHRILKLARTIADLAGTEQIQTAHVAEAIPYRPRQVI